MIIKTRLFDIATKHYVNLSELAIAMGISVSQIYRVKSGQRQINQKFIAGALKALPGSRFEDLFYLAPAEDSCDNQVRSRSRARFPLARTQRIDVDCPALRKRHVSQERADS